MRITLINQAFYPDVVSSGQHLTDLAVALAEKEHEVTVVTSRRAYDNPNKTFPGFELWRGIKIYRVFNTGFGKRAKWRRAVDFLTFLISCCIRLILLRRPEAIVALTSPPLISVIAAGFAKLSGAQFCYWIMDLNPDEAVAAGWLNPNSLAAKWLERLSRFSLRNASRIVVLDDFMQKRILDKGISPEKVSVIPPWSHDSEVKFDPSGRAQFRKLHGLEDKFVVMYAGNHSPCHPLTTILEAIKRLSDRKDLAFYFVGGGSEQKRVKEFAQTEKLANVVCLPYQPLDQLAGMLSSADLHLVVMGDPFVGLVHPCKAYNLLQISAPILYVGPQPSHITRILEKADGTLPCAMARHGDAPGIQKAITKLQIKIASDVRNRQDSPQMAEQFSMQALLPQMVDAVVTPRKN